MNHIRALLFKKSSELKHVCWQQLFSYLDFICLGSQFETLWLWILDPNWLKTLLQCLKPWTLLDFGLGFGWELFRASLLNVWRLVSLLCLSAGVCTHAHLHSYFLPISSIKPISKVCNFFSAWVAVLGLGQDTRSLSSFQCDQSCYPSEPALGTGNEKDCSPLFPWPVQVNVERDR